MLSAVDIVNKNNIDFGMLKLFAVNYLSNNANNDDGLEVLKYISYNIKETVYAYQIGLVILHINPYSIISKYFINNLCNKKSYQDNNIQYKNIILNKLKNSDVVSEAILSTLVAEYENSIDIITAILDQKNIKLFKTLDHLSRKSINGDVLKLVIDKSDEVDNGLKLLINIFLRSGDFEVIIDEDVFEICFNKIKRNIKLQAIS